MDRLGPIDLVYTWCDAADTAWSAKREAAARAAGSAAARGAAPCRFAANDELRFSLRSAAKFLPWLRTVFIVIDSDAVPPHWLREVPGRLRIVRHSEIMPPELLPCFCSGTIEHHIARIPGLAPLFIYSNDDMLFGRPLTPRFFFGRDGFPVFRFGVRRNPSPETREANFNYISNLERAVALAKEAHPAPRRDLAEALLRYPHHCADSYVRDDLLATYERYRATLEPTFRFPFRSPDKVQRVIYAYEALAQGRGHFRVARFRTTERRSWWKRLLRPGWADTLQFFGDGWREGPAMLRRWKPGAFCFNDTEQTPDADRAWLASFLETLFPEPSPFEEGAS